MPRRGQRKKLGKLPPYEYHPLEQNDFRTVYLHPGKPRDPIIISIAQLPQSIDSYTAISYVWGDPSRDCKIYANDTCAHKGANAPEMGQQVMQGFRKEKATCDGDADVASRGGKDPAFDDRKPDVWLECPKRPTGYLKVTRNLFNLLVGVRSEDTYQPLWIDALCINQDDHREKSHQVKQMTTIYGLAFVTIAYIGEWDEVMRLAFTTINAFASLGNVPPALAGQPVPERLTHAARHPQWCRTQTPITTAWEAFIACLELPWFHRIWVVQEVVLSRNVLVCSGRYHIKWQTLVAACKAVSESPIMFLDVGRGRIMGPTYLEEQRVAYRAFLDRSRRKSYPQLDDWTQEDEDRLLLEIVRTNDFVSLLIKTRGRGASDPRDHIFALMGIAKGAKQHYMPEVDYTRSVTDVFTQAAYAWHTWSHRRPLCFLPGVNELCDQTDLPTWLPDWRRPWNLEPFSTIVAWSPEDSILKSRVRIEFPNMTAPKFVLPLTLKVRGCRLTAIKDVEYLKAEGPWLTKRHADLINHFPKPYPTTYISYREAFRLSVQPHEHGGQLPCRRSEGFWALPKAPASRRRLRPLFRGEESKFLQTPLPLVARFGQGGGTIDILTLNNGSSRGEFEPRYTPEQLYNSIFPAFRSAMITPLERHARSRVWFITHDGFMGLTTDIARRGDVIVNLFGGDTPYVLRRKREKDGKATWEYIGAAFVLGLMRGEADYNLPEDAVEDFEVQ